MREKRRRLPRIHSFLPHLSAALTSSPAGGGTYPSVTSASGGDTSPCRGDFCVAAPAEGVAFGRFLYHPFDQATRRSAARGPHPALRATFPVRGEGDGRTTEDPAAWQPPGSMLCKFRRFADRAMRRQARGPLAITPRPGPAWPRRSSGSRPHWRPASDRPACRTPQRRRSRPCRCSS